MPDEMLIYDILTTDFFGGFTRRNFIARSGVVSGQSSSNVIGMERALSSALSSSAVKASSSLSIKSRPASHFFYILTDYCLFFNNLFCKDYASKCKPSLLRRITDDWKANQRNGVNPSFDLAKNPHLSLPELRRGGKGKRRPVGLRLLRGLRQADV